MLDRASSWWRLISWPSVRGPGLDWWSIRLGQRESRSRHSIVDLFPPPFQSVISFKLSYFAEDRGHWQCASDKV